MIAVDVMNPADVRAAGIRVLNKELGADIADVFMKQCFGGYGDYTQERSESPDWTQAEYDKFMKAAETEAVAAGVW